MCLEAEVKSTDELVLQVCSAPSNLATQYTAHDFMHVLLEAVPIDECLL
jgi:hypothetical protein